MLQNVLDTLGGIISKNNLNLKAVGEKNRGTVESNNSISLNCSNCALHLIGNSNLKINSTNSALDMTSVANGSVTGDTNTLVGAANNNLQFEGNCNNSILNGNNNLKHYCNKSITNFEGNSNAKISGSGNDVFAKDNTNLKIEGDNNKIYVEGKANHVLSRGKNIFKVTNMVEARPRGFFASLIRGSSRTGNSISYSVSSEGDTKIVGEDYTLGIFNFKRILGQGVVDVAMNETGLDPGSIKIIEQDGKQVIISGTKDSIKQQFTLIGPSVTRLREGQNEIGFRINLSSPPGL